MANLVGHFQGRVDELTTVLVELVETESPSLDKSAVDRMGTKVAAMMLAADARVDRLPQEHRGDMVLGRWPGGHDGRQILLLCHMDTVWPLGTLADRPVRMENGRLYGPGAFDMKAGIVIALAALCSLETLGRKPAAPVVMLCNGDEEIGSPVSRAFIEAQAQASDLVLCLEPAIPGGLIKTARKGVMTFTVRAEGRAAHAGADHAQGVNAIEEMARQVLALHALTDYASGTTVNVGVITGGSARNVVPARCEMQVDVRVTSQDEASRVQQILMALEPRIPGTRLSVAGGLGHPPMVRDELMVRTFAQVSRIADRHGLTVREGSTGGGSDGSFAAAQGVPTIDGLGPDGDGAHAVHEHVLVDSLVQRAALVAAILTEWQFGGDE